MLTEEQAALRRVATLVARGVPPNEIFAAVAEEIGRLISIDGTRILRYEADGTATVIAGWSEAVEVPPELEVGARLALEGESVSTLVLRTGRPARIDSYANAAGPLSEPLHQVAGVRSAAGAPTPEPTPSSRAAIPSGPEASAKPSIRAARPVWKTSVLTFFPPRLHRGPPRGAMGSPPVLPQPATMVIVVPSDS